MLVLFLFILDAIIGYNVGSGNLKGLLPIYTHETIEKFALPMASSTFFTSKVIKEVYWGNWLRDYSQLNGELLKKHLNQQTIVDIVSVMAEREGFHELEGGFFVSDSILGVYQSAEHMDNPKKAKDLRYLDSRFKGPAIQEELHISPDSMQKNYFENTIQYISGKINLSIQKFKEATNSNRKGVQKRLFMHAFREFGAALHPLEDFYSHSNWMELSLIELGYTTVFPLVGDKSGFACSNAMGYCYPLITGTGTQGMIDHQINLLSLIQRTIASKIITVKNKLRKRDLSHDHYKRISIEFAHLNESSVMVKSILLSLLGKAGERKRDLVQEYSGDFEDDSFTDPRHSTVNKDYNFNPLHIPSSKCAINAVSIVAREMLLAWHGEVAADRVVDVVRGFIRHPYLMRTSGSYVWELLSPFVADWARENGDLIDRLSKDRVLKGTRDFS